MKCLDPQRTLRYGKINPARREDPITGRDMVFVAQDIQDLNNCIEDLLASVAALEATISSGSSGLGYAIEIEHEEAAGTVDGSNNTFDLTYAPINKSSTIGFLNGKRLSPHDYFFNGTEVIFSTPPRAGSGQPYFIYARPDGLDIPAAIAEVPTGLINNSNTKFTISSEADDPDSFILILNGLVLTQGVDYSLNGTIIEMAFAPTWGSVLQSYRDAIFGAPAGIDFVFERPLGDINSSNTGFLTSRPPISANHMLFAINGNSMYGPADISSVSGITTTLSFAPTSGSDLWLSYATYSDPDALKLERFREVDKDGPVYVTDEVVIIKCSTANVTVDLPPPSTVRRRMLTFIREDATGYTATVDGGSTPLGYGGGTTQTLPAQNSVLNLMPYKDRYLMTR